MTNKSIFTLDNYANSTDAELLVFINSSNLPSKVAFSVDQRISAAIDKFKAFWADEQAALMEYNRFKEVDFDLNREEMFDANVPMLEIIYTYTDDVYGTPNFREITEAYAQALQMEHRANLLEQAAAILKKTIPAVEHEERDIELLRSEMLYLDPFLLNFTLVLEELSRNDEQLNKIFHITKNKNTKLSKPDELREIIDGLSSFKRLSNSQDISPAQEVKHLLALLLAKYDLLALAGNHGLMNLLHEQIKQQREILRRMGHPPKAPPPSPARKLKVMTTAQRKERVARINRELYTEQGIKLDKHKEVGQLQQFLAERAAVIENQAQQMLRNVNIGAKVAYTFKDSGAAQYKKIQKGFDGVINAIEEGALNVQNMAKCVVTDATAKVQAASNHAANIAEQADSLRNEKNPLRAAQKAYNLAKDLYQTYNDVCDFAQDKRNHVQRGFNKYMQQAWKIIKPIFKKLHALILEVVAWLKRTKQKYSASVATELKNNTNKMDKETSKVARENDKAYYQPGIVFKNAAGSRLSHNLTKPRLV